MMAFALLRQTPSSPGARAPVFQGASGSGADRAHRRAPAASIAARRDDAIATWPRVRGYHAAEDRQATIERARAAELRAIVVNGLEPKSNREILEMAAREAIIWPALGIYPVDAVNHELPEDFPLSVSRFDVDTEIAYIDEMAASGRLRAIGECGLDGHWLPEATYARQ